MIKRRVSPQRIGIVEGFFSRPLAMWTLEERLNTLKFCCANAPNINAYFYCPKQDEFVTERWRDLYPPAELSELKSVITFCQEHEIKFIFGLNPELKSEELSSAEDLAAWLSLVLHKLRQIMALGCDLVCLLFDDIPLAYDVVDSSVDGAKEAAELMVKLVNEIFTTLSPELEGFYLCSPDYCLQEETVVTRAQRRLNPGIKYIWTGNTIFAPTISNGDAIRAAELRENDSGLTWWVNYPVNDCEHNLGIFNLGGFVAPELEVLERLDAIFVNPMRESAANLPFYITVSDYAGAPDSYQREVSWSKALATLFSGLFPECCMVLEEFSAPNCADTVYKYGYSIMKDASEEGATRFLDLIDCGLAQSAKIAQSGGAAGDFIRTVSAVFKSASWYRDIARKLLSKMPVTLKEILTGDLFPTNPAQARYCSEIAKIVQARLDLITDGVVIPEFLLAPVREFESKYRGRAKLHLEPVDTVRCAEASLAMIKFEQEQLVLMLNDYRRSVVPRLTLMGQRLSINRFTWR